MYSKNFFMGAFNGHCAADVIQIIFHLLNIEDLLFFIYAHNANSDRNPKKQNLK